MRSREILIMGIHAFHGFLTMVFFLGLLLPALLLGKRRSDVNAIPENPHGVTGKEDFERF